MKFKHCNRFGSSVALERSHVWFESNSIRILTWLDSIWCTCEPYSLQQCEGLPTVLENAIIQGCTISIECLVMMCMCVEKYWVPLRTIEFNIDRRVVAVEGDTWMTTIFYPSVWSSFPVILLNVFSQVGYGDIYCVTDWGRVFIVIYVTGGFSVFANFLPELAQILGNRPR